MAAPGISVVITAHNEGAELPKTLDSVVLNTTNLREIIVVDDGSEDGSCDGVAGGLVRVIRHDERIGVAYSRDEGSRMARGDVICYLDGHQRVGRRCLDRCAALAFERGAIVSPDVRNFGLFTFRLHGAEFRLCPQNGFFSARWRDSFYFRRITPVSALRAPPYLIPRSLYDSVAWSRSLRGWGASEASMVLKSFFMGIPILHFMGPTARHLFRKEFPYATNWEGIWRNHAIIARVCFEEATWREYWLPRLFQSHLTEEALETLASPAVQQEHRTFVARKRRTDADFWRVLLRQDPPAEVCESRDAGSVECKSGGYL